jgi:site-specific recombinase XerD
MAHLRKRPYTKPIPPGAEFITRKGRPYVRFKVRNGKTIEGPVSKDGKRVRLQSKKWYGEYRSRDGILHTVPLSSDRSASEILLAELVRKVEMGLAGCSDPFEEHRKRPLAEHVEDFRRAMEARNNSPKHVSTTLSRVQTVLEGCGFVFLPDVQASQVAEWLADERTAGRLSITTANYYQRDLKSFLTWLVKDSRTASNPLTHLAYLNTATEEHRERRALPRWEFEALMAAALAGKRVRKQAGPDRFMLYIVAGETGFRAQELASLTRTSFQLDGPAPTATVEAAYSKHKRQDVQPIRVELAELVHDWLAGKPAGEKLWPGYWWRHAAKMVRHDLETARNAWIEEARDDADERQRRRLADCLNYQDRDGRYFDFHCLRGQFISELAAAGVSLKTLQTLARHGDSSTTMKHYVRVQLSDTQAALDKLPPIPGQTLRRAAAKATGTDGAGLTATSPACAPACAAPADSCGSVRTGEDGEAAMVSGSGGRKSQDLQSVAGECGQMRTGAEERPLPDSNRGWRICNPLPYHLAKGPRLAVLGS